MVGITRQHITQQIALALVIRSLESTQQLVECLKHLGRKLSRNDVLVLAAVCKNRWQPLLFGDAVESLGAEEHLQSREDRASRNLNHVPKVERDMTAQFFLRCVHESDLTPVHKQTDVHSGLTKQALESCLWTGLPTTIVRRERLVKIRSGWKHFNQQEPLALA